MLNRQCNNVMRTSFVTLRLTPLQRWRKTSNWRLQSGPHRHGGIHRRLFPRSVQGSHQRPRRPSMKALPQSGSPLILALKIYHMREKLSVWDASLAHRAACQTKLDILLEQRHDLSSAIEQLLGDVAAGNKYMKVYKQIQCMWQRAQPCIAGPIKPWASFRHIVVARFSTWATWPCWCQSCEPCWSKSAALTWLRPQFAPIFSNIEDLSKTLDLKFGFWYDGAVAFM